MMKTKRNSMTCKLRPYDAEFKYLKFRTDENGYVSDKDHDRIQKFTGDRYFKSKVYMNDNGRIGFLLDGKNQKFIDASTPDVTYYIVKDQGQSYLDIIDVLIDTEFIHKYVITPND